jgi:hypothetical protein
MDAIWHAIVHEGDEKIGRLCPRDHVWFVKGPQAEIEKYNAPRTTANDEPEQIQRQTQRQDI